MVLTGEACSKTLSPGGVPCNLEITKSEQYQAKY
jgi:hypothetical protein